MVQAGKLRHKLTIQESTSASLKSTATGEPLTVWTTFTSNVWCSAEPLSGSEFFSEDQRYTRNTFRFNVRHDPIFPINQGMRIVFDSLNYNIIEVINPDVRNRLSVITGELVT